MWINKVSDFDSEHLRKSSKHGIADFVVFLQEAMHVCHNASKNNYVQAIKILNGENWVFLYKYNI